MRGHAIHGTSIITSSCSIITGLGTIDTSNGHTQYYLGVVPGSWRTFGTEDDSFWCCNGTGTEEYSKLADSIYFRSADAVFVNLFIPSDLYWKERHIRLRQTNQFPHEPRTHLEVIVDSPQHFALNIRVPSWVSSFPAVSVNGKPLELSAGPGSYLVLARSWRNGDQIEVTLPMSVCARPMPDDPSQQAFLYGPLLLADIVGDRRVPEKLAIGLMGPEFKKHAPPPVPELHAVSADSNEWIRKRPESLTFDVPGSVTLVPFNSIGAGQLYSVYWKVS